jgi:hypothetical protein
VYNEATSDCNKWYVFKFVMYLRKTKDEEKLPDGTVLGTGDTTTSNFM